MNSATTSEMVLSASVNPNRLQEVRNYLDAFVVEVQDKIVKSALRQYAKDQCAVAASLTPQRYVQSRKHLAYRVKFWPSGIAWVGVGYRMIPGTVPGGEIGRSRRAIYDLYGTGWRTHFMELGFHTWGKGLRKPPRALGRGWKRRLYHRGRGVYHRGKFVSLMTLQATSHRVIPYLMREIDFMIRKREVGRRARRKAVNSYVGIGR